eukprot:CAMPEP_0182422382 /NCGR_PEP_ID=MMETSP1167-20130531/8049_1 /TAXON_ID=2988 /ORGANISM="Mallomonas Sp, Strain CCMP3275" /LENGTH=288 /DNA_ID=CAMNT_0024600395 /DNA_START=195 /DNA_END=1061 /DNA_ORIENTATION=+
MTSSSFTLQSSIAMPYNDNSQLYQPVNPGPHLNIKGKVINIWGVLYAISALSTAFITLPFMLILSLACDLFGDSKRRRILDWAIHMWANVAMSLVFFRPKLIGAENLPKNGETVIYVPNHTSVMDILALSGFVPRPFKYLSKAEILKVPIIARAMILAKHVFIRREDVLDAFGTSEKCVRLLRDGNSMVLFAEGTRSPDGKLRKFKKGAFQMAKAAGVRVVPVTIANLHRWMPTSAFLPLGPARGVEIHIHPAIDSKNMTTKDLKNKCFEAVNSGLQPYQKYVDRKST